jgi:hypothetical protein
MLTRAVEITELPPHQQGERVAALDREFGLRPQGPSRMLRQLLGLHLLERYRIDAAPPGVGAEPDRAGGGGALPQGQRPLAESVTALVPVYLKRRAAGPLRRRARPNEADSFGIVVYCVGRDGKDDGGRINREAPDEPGTDVGLRLWDVAKRRQPVPPPAAENAGAPQPGMP